MATNKAVSSSATRIDAQVLGESFIHLAERLSDGICMIDAGGKIVYANASFMRIVGFDAAEVLGKNFLQILSSDKSARDLFDISIDSGKIEVFECVLLTKTGEQIWTRCNSVPLKSDQHGTRGATLLVQDITAARAADITHARLAAIIESSDDAIVSKDLNGIIQTWNKGAEEIFGYSAEEIVGKPVQTLLPDDRKGEENVILDTLRKGKRIDHYETVRKRKDGTLIDISVTVSPICDAEGKVVGASKVARNITRRKAAERELEMSQAALKALTDELDQRVKLRTAELEQANKELEGFTYAVSHDLRAPLRAIVSTSRVIIEDFGGHLPFDAKDHLERQAEAAEKMAVLIDELLQLSRVSRSTIQLQDVDLSAIAETIVAEITKSDPESLVEFSVQPRMRAQGDPRLLRLLMLNLMDNARKFSPTGGVVSVGCRVLDDERVYFVKDHGIGFDMRYVEKTFQPFERLVHEMEFPGTGIGLANAQRIVERHNGSIWAESAVGKGATFFFKLGSDKDGSR